MWTNLSFACQCGWVVHIEKAITEKKEKKKYETRKENEEEEVEW